MNTADRRTEIINILIIRRRTTARELADEFGVTTRTIQKDIQALSPGYPIYTKQGGDGGIFIGDDYKPYVNTLSADELKLCVKYMDRQRERKRKSCCRSYINTAPINWNYKLAIPLKHIIFTELFIADRECLCAFWAGKSRRDFIQNRQRVFCPPTQAGVCTLIIEYVNTYGTCGMCGAAMRTRQELPASIFVWKCIRGNIEIWY